MTVIRNVLIGCGVFYIARWVRLPLEWWWSSVFNRLSFVGDLQAGLLMPAVSAVPNSILAFVAGVVTASAVKARYPARWALLPAGLFLQQHLLARREWYVTPRTIDYVAIAVEGLIPCLACLIGAAIAEGRQNRPKAV